MAKNSFVIDEAKPVDDSDKMPEVPEMKETMSIKESDLPGISKVKLGDKVSLKVEGTVASISSGFGTKDPRVSIDIDSVEQEEKEGGNTNV